MDYSTAAGLIYRKGRREKFPNMFGPLGIDTKMATPRLFVLIAGVHSDALLPFCFELCRKRFADTALVSKYQPDPAHRSWCRGHIFLIGLP